MEVTGDHTKSNFGGVVRAKARLEQVQERLREGLPCLAQWLRLHAPNAGGKCSIPGQGTKIPHAAWCGQKKKKERERLRGEEFKTLSRQATKEKKR